MMKTEGGGKYQVKLVPTHCHRTETIVDIISALDHLNVITNEIFSSIKEKVSSQQAQVSSLAARVTVAAEQVEQLKTSQKGVRILSAAKYPSTYPEDESKGALSVTFPTLNTKPIPPQASLISAESFAMLQSRKFTSPVTNPSELLQFYHVRDVNATNANIERVENLYETGLGNPSENLNTTDSFLLFNTALNPYQNYRVTEKSSKKSLSNKMPKKVETMEELPKIEQDDSKKENLPENDDFYYYPTSLTIPDIDVPDFLPDLPGINLVGNTMDLYPKPIIQRPTTTPTVSNAVIPPPPPFPINNDDIILASSTVPSTTHPVSSSSKPQGSDVSTPSVPVPTGTISTPIVTSAPSFIPPPPPLPPPMILPPEQVEEKKVEPKKQKIPAPAVDVRSSLMAAIRDAGGTGKLRSAKDRKYEAKKKKQEEKEKENTATEGNDLMADLKNSLAMRRRGISGMNDGNKAGLGDIMNKLAATIPTLEDSNEEVAGGSVSDDDDWDS